MQLNDSKYVIAGMLLYAAIFTVAFKAAFPTMTWQLPLWMQ